MLLHSMYDYSMLDILASIQIWLYYIPFLLFAILLPCIWHLSFVHAGFSLCNALCHSSFYHYSYSVLSLFLLRHAIIASSMHGSLVYANCNYTSRWRFTRRWSLKVVVRVRVRVGEKPSWELKLLTISLLVHGFSPNLEVFILVWVEVCHKFK